MLLERGIRQSITIKGNIVEQEKENNLTEFRIYEHPLLPKRLVKRGFCWPALIVGPAYLIYRRLWIQLVVWIAAIFLIRYFTIQSFQVCDVWGRNCSIGEADIDTVKIISDGAFFVGMFVIGDFTNSFWEEDLIKRGYILTKSIHARSLDEARAIIAREKLPIDPPAHKE